MYAGYGLSICVIMYTHALCVRPAILYMHNINLYVSRFVFHCIAICSVLLNIHSVQLDLYAQYGIVFSMS